MVLGPRVVWSTVPFPSKSHWYLLMVSPSGSVNAALNVTVSPTVDAGGVAVSVPVSAEPP